MTWHHGRGHIVGSCVCMCCVLSFLMHFPEICSTLIQDTFCHSVSGPTFSAGCVSLPPLCALSCQCCAHVLGSCLRGVTQACAARAVPSRTPSPPGASAWVSPTAGRGLLPQRHPVASSLRPVPDTIGLLDSASCQGSLCPFTYLGKP